MDQTEAIRSCDTFDAVFRHRDWVYTLAKRLVVDANDADDVVQEVWINAIQNPPHRRKNLKGWLHVVARRVVSRQRRTRERQQRRERLAARSLPDADPPTVEVAAERARESVRKAVSGMPEPYRSTVLHLLEQGGNMEAVARQMGVPVETVRTRWKRAAHRLRTRLDAEYGGDRRAWLAPLLVLGGEPRSVLPAKIVAASILAITLGSVAVRMTSGEPPPVVKASPRPIAVSSGKPERVARVAAATAATAAKIGAGKTAKSEARTPMGPALRGEVVDPSGRAVPRALVVAFGTRHRSNVVGSTAPLVSIGQARTDDHGRFHLRYRGNVVFVEAVGRGLSREVVIPSARESARARLRIALRRPGRIQGQALHADGTPIASVNVSLKDPDRPLTFTGFGAGGEPRRIRYPTAYATVRTDDHGRFHFTSVAPGRYQVVVFPAHLPFARETVDVISNRTHAVAVRLPASRSIRLAGRVLEVGTRRPVAGASIHEDLDTPSIAITDDEGRFTVSLASGRYVRLVARAEGRPPGATRTFRVPEFDTAREIRLEAPWPAAGRVVDPEGRPVEGARVFQPGSGARTRTDADGRFRLEGLSLERGRRIHVLAHGFCEAVSPPLAESPRTREGIVVRLGRGGSLQGQLYLENMVEAHDVRLCLAPTSLAFRPCLVHRGRTDSAASFRFDHVAPGRYRLSAWLGRHYHRFPDIVDVVECGTSTASFHLRSCAPSRISGRVVDDRGAPVRSARVRAVANGGEASDPDADVVYTARDGRFRFAGLPRSVHQLRIDAGGTFQPMTVRDVRPGDPPLTLRLSARPVAGGRVVDEDGRPVESFWIRAFPHRSGDPALSWRRFVRAPDGRFRLGVKADSLAPPPLPDGVYDLEAGTPDGRVSPLIRGVRIPGRHDLVLPLGPGAELQGVIRSSEGAPVAGALVQIAPVAPAAAEVHEVRTGPSGRYHVRPLRCGSYRLRVRHRDAGVGGANTHVGRGSTRAVDVGLAPEGKLSVSIATRRGGFAGDRRDDDSRFTCTLRSLGERDTVARQSGRTGPFRFAALVPGLYEVAVSTAGGPEATRHVAVHGGRSTSITIPLPPGAR